MNGICPKMKGAKCAEKYCDFWNGEEQTCSLALESKLRTEILQTLLEKARKIESKAKDVEKINQLAAKMNIVSSPDTLQ